MQHRYTFVPLLAAALLTGVAATGCRLDPVPQNQIDKLPPEDTAGPSALHRQGQPCVLCHSEYEGAEPTLAVGGTVYQQNIATLQIAPVEGVKVFVYDSSGDVRFACTNAGGNFYIEEINWSEVTFPLTAQVGNRFMRSLIGRERSCASCHRLATQTRVDNDNSVDISTGASRDSAGAILVSPADLTDTQTCGPNPAGSSSASSSSGAGGGAATSTTSGAGGMMGSGGAGGATTTASSSSSSGTGGTGGTPTSGSGGGGGA